MINVMGVVLGFDNANSSRGWLGFNNDNSNGG